MRFLHRQLLKCGVMRSRLTPYSGGVRCPHLTHSSPLHLLLIFAAIICTSNFLHVDTENGVAELTICRVSTPSADGCGTRPTTTAFPPVSGGKQKGGRHCES